MLSTEREDRAFRALAHRDRRRLLRAIGPDEHTVGALADEVGLDQPIASQHLRVLRDAGLVEVRAEGTRRLYTIQFQRIGELRAFLDQFWNDRLNSLRDVAESLAADAREDG